MFQGNMKVQRKKEKRKIGRCEDTKQIRRCEDTKQIRVANCKFRLNFQVIFVIFASLFLILFWHWGKKMSVEIEYQAIFLII